MKLEAAMSDLDGHGVTVSFDSASLTVSKAEVLLPRLASIRTSCAVAMDQCRELLMVAAPEIARKRHQEARQGSKE